jgi:large subunit ribosomal protein L14e
MRGIKMPLIEQGRICIVTKGKDAGKEVVIKEVIDKTFVKIVGERVKERRANIKHLEITARKVTKVPAGKVPKVKEKKAPKEAEEKPKKAKKEKKTAEKKEKKVEEEKPKESKADAAAREMLEEAMVAVKEKGAKK